MIKEHLRSLFFNVNQLFFDKSCLLLLSSYCATLVWTMTGREFVNPSRPESQAEMTFSTLWMRNNRGSITQDSTS
jgi:hypothetical protein